MGATLGKLTPAETAQLADPAAPLPPGVAPGTHDYSVAVGSTAVRIICFVVIALFVGTRFVARSFHLEDFFIVLAILANFAFDIVSQVAVADGLVEHMWALTLGEYFRFLHFASAATATYSITILFIKLAIPLQWLRIFVPDRRLNRLLWLGCWATIITNFICYTAVIFAELFVCPPVAEAWDLFTQGGYCPRDSALYKATGVYNVVSDVPLLLLPLLGISQLGLNFKQKVIIASGFSAGILACIMSVIRTIYTWVTYNARDTVWDMDIAAIISEIEVTAGILAFCVPTTPQVYRYFRDKFSTSKAEPSLPSEQASQVSHVSQYMSNDNIV